MLQRKRFIFVLTVVTVCTLFSAGFTTQRAVMETRAAYYIEKDGVETLYDAADRISEEQERAEEAARAAAEAARREQAARAAEVAAALAAQEAEKTAQAASGLEVQGRESTAAQTETAYAGAAGDPELLAAIIFCEAGNQPYEGQVAVGAVILNRVRSGVYPGSVSEVIYQAGQFGPAMSGWFDSVLANGGWTETAMQAAQDALAGVNPIGNCLYFGNGDYGIQIGDHFFH